MFWKKERTYKGLYEKEYAKVKLAIDKLRKGTQEGIYRWHIEENNVFICSHIYEDNLKIYCRLEEIYLDKKGIVWKLSFKHEDKKGSYLVTSLFAEDLVDVVREQLYEFSLDDFIKSEEV